MKVMSLLCSALTQAPMSIDDIEFAKYASLQEDIDIHNISSDQSLILHDTLYIDCRRSYADRARSKDIVYNVNTTLAHTLNEQKFNDNYRHNKSTRQYMALVHTHIYTRQYSFCSRIYDRSPYVSHSRKCIK